jgi:hypothetical protein
MAKVVALPTACDVVSKAALDSSFEQSSRNLRPSIPRNMAAANWRQAKFILEFEVQGQGQPWKAGARELSRP